VSSEDERFARAARPRPAARRGDAKSARRRARELALQGLYEWLLNRADVGAVDAHVREQEDFDKCDREHFELLLHGAIRDAATIDAALAAHIDRKVGLLSPIEHGALMIGAFELMRCIEIPYKVAINEAVELAKSFGGTDGHKYVNGVLDKVAAEVRRIEVDAARKKSE
jgi:N utilization substance protein B